MFEKWASWINIMMMMMMMMIIIIIVIIIIIIIIIVIFLTIKNLYSILIKKTHLQCLT